jgi:hypothetical protein
LNKVSYGAFIGVFKCLSFNEPFNAVERIGVNGVGKVKELATDVSS